MEDVERYDEEARTKTLAPPPVWKNVSPSCFVNAANHYVLSAPSLLIAAQL